MTPHQVPDISPLGGFTQASESVLRFLHERMGFGLWMVTRTEGADWVVLQAEDHGYGVQTGRVFQWADSFCSRMVRGEGPSVAPRSDLVAAYRDAPIAAQVPIKAYVGLPLRLRDGQLFGTLCAIDPQPQPEHIVKELPLLTLLATLLSTVLQSELRASEQSRRAERLYSEAVTDSATGLYNRRGWDRLMRAEEERCRRFGHAAGVIVIDLDELKRINDSAGHAAGDAVIERAAHALRTASRSGDVVARLGGDEFGVLAVETDQAGCEVLLQRIEAALQADGVKASCGLCMRAHDASLQEAWKTADLRMYQAKRNR